MTLTDKKLAELLSLEISDNYTTALDFIDQKPDYTLMKFRKTLEGIVCAVAAKNNITFNNHNLAEKINELNDCQVINHAQSSHFHELRTLGNAGVHSSQANEKTKSTQSENIIASQRKTLIDAATKARKLIISIMSEAYTLIYGKTLSNIELAPVGHQRFKEILYEGVTSICGKAKLKAGLMLQEILREHSIQSTFIVSDEFASHTKSLRLQILAFFESACVISSKSNTSNSYSYELEPAVCKFADTEALYHYAMIAGHPDFHDDHGVKAIGRLKASAERGNIQACGAYGCHLYDNKSYKDSLDFLTLGALEDDVDSLCLLYEYFTEGKACEPDIEKAKSFLNKAIDLGSADALAALGEALDKGIGVDKDDNKALSLLQEAEKKGSIRAYNYRVKTKIEKIPQLFQASLGLLEESLKHNKNNLRKKVGRNELCPCDSGIKYKKCCGR